MRRTIKLLTLTAMIAVFAAPVLAQTKECNDVFKSATYQKWYDNRKDHQDVAYDAAKEYVTVCPDDTSPYATAIKKFKDAYEALKADVSTKTQFEAAYKTKKYADQIRLGKQIVATDPENSTVYIIMGLAGLGDESLVAESAQYAKKAIEMIEAGKSFAPLFTAKDQPLAYLNYEIAKSNLKSAPTDAIPYLLKAARFESDLKKQALLYLDLANAYNTGPRAKLSADYKAAHYTVETPESKLALANINQIIDRQIDALARAVALATNTADKKNVMDVLTQTYKDRNQSEAGLNELVANILSKPLPDMPTPLTSLPSDMGSSTPATSGSPGTNGAGSTGTTGGNKPAGNNTTTSGQNKTGSTSGSATGAQTGAKTNGGAKPSPSPTPNKPKARRNHRA